MTKRRVYVRRGVAHVCAFGATYGVSSARVSGVRDVVVRDRDIANDELVVEYQSGAGDRWPRVRFVSERPRRSAVTRRARFVVFLPGGRAVFWSLDVAIAAARAGARAAMSETWRREKCGEIWGGHWADGPIGTVAHDGVWTAR